MAKQLSAAQLTGMVCVASDLFYMISNKDVFCFGKKTTDLYHRFESVYASRDASKKIKVLRDAAEFLREHVVGCDEIFSKHLLKNAKKIIDAAGRV